MVNRIIRNIVCLFLWGGLEFLFLAVNGVVILSNYLATKAALELSGYERRPLETDEMLGRMLGALFPNASLAHLYAAGIALTMGICFFLVFHMAMKMVEYYRARQSYLQQGDQQSGDAAVQYIYWYGILLLFILIPLIYAVIWDIELFRFRSVCGSHGIEDPEEAVKNITKWTSQLKENGHLMAWDLIRIGTWGYLGITVMACLFLEIGWLKIWEHFDLLSENIRKIFETKTDEEDVQPFYGYDTLGNPVFDPNTPIAYDTEGNLTEKEHGQPQATTLRQVQHTHSNPSCTAINPGNIPNSESGFHQADYMTNQQTSAQYHQQGTPLFDPNLSAGSQSSFSNVEENVDHKVFGQSINRTTSQILKVIGSQGDGITLAEARADKDRYWIDPDTHEVWLARYREALFGDAYKKAA